MDYKFIILLILLLGLILFLTKEFANIYKKVDENQCHLISYVDENTDGIKKQVRSDLSVCLGKIKTFNDDCIKKVRRMDMLESQVVANMSNHCTDSDNEDASKQMNMMCLSDMMKQKHQNTQDEYYRESDTSSKKKSKHTDQEFIIKYKSSEEKPKNNQNINAEALVTKVTELIKSENDVVLTPAQQVSPFVQGTFSNQNLKTQSHKSTTSSSTKKSSQHPVSSSTDATNSVENTTENSVETNDDDSDSEEKSSTQSASSKESSTLENSSSDGIEVEFASSGKSSSSNKSSNKSKKEISKKEDYSNCGITIGSRRTGKVPNITVNKNAHNENSENVSKESQRDTEEIGEELMDTFDNDNSKLKPVNKYSIEDLRKMAKTYSIPLTFTDSSGTRRYFKREDLYKKLQSNFAKSNKIF